MPDTNGIIPADAGSTRTVVAHRSWRQDHPRGCGEHPISACSMPRLRGSSPRMRGALQSRVSLCADIRIIPADAGSTNSDFIMYIRSKDHPRGCGEHRLSTKG